MRFALLDGLLSRRRLFALIPLPFLAPRPPSVFVADPDPLAAAAATFFRALGRFTSFDAVLDELLESDPSLAAFWDRTYDMFQAETDAAEAALLALMRARGVSGVQHLGRLFIDQARDLGADCDRRRQCVTTVLVRDVATVD